MHRRRVYVASAINPRAPAHWRYLIARHCGAYRSCTVAAAIYRQRSRSVIRCAYGSADFWTRTRSSWKLAFHGWEGTRLLCIFGSVATVVIWQFDCGWNTGRILGRVVVSGDFKKVGWCGWRRNVIYKYVGLDDKVIDLKKFSFILEIFTSCSDIYLWGR